VRLLRFKVLTEVTQYFLQLLPQVVVVVVAQEFLVELVELVAQVVVVQALMGAQGVQYQDKVLRVVQVTLMVVAEAEVQVSQVRLVQETVAEMVETERHQVIQVHQ
jgi:hypothetical protein